MKSFDDLVESVRVASCWPDSQRKFNLIEADVFRFLMKKLAVLYDLYPVAVTEHQYHFNTSIGLLFNGGPITTTADILQKFEEFFGEMFQVRILRHFLGNESLFNFIFFYMEGFEETSIDTNLCAIGRIRADQRICASASVQYCIHNFVQSEYSRMD